MLIAVFSEDKISFECFQSSLECKTPIFSIKKEPIHAKNIAVTKFLQSPEFSHLLLVSADYGWKMDQVAKLMAANLPFVAVSTPVKISPQNVVAGIMRATQTKNMESFFDYNMILTKDKSGKVNMRGPLIEANYAKIEFCLIRRDLVEKMIRRLQTYELNGEMIYPFFRQTLNNPNNIGILVEKGEKKAMFAEDDEFCDHIRQLGEKIWIYKDFDLLGEFNTNFQRSIISRQ